MSASDPINSIPQDDDGGCSSGVWAPPKPFPWLRQPQTAPTQSDSTETVVIIGAEKDANQVDDQVENGDKESNRALCCSLMTLLFSIPAIVGAWCWPALVIGLIGGTVSASARQTGHSISLGITAGMMALVLGYIFWTSKRRAGRGWWHQYGPTVLTFIAACCILADPTRHVMQDTGAWPAPGSSEYRSDCDSESIRCLSVVGWIITFFCTYFGFALLVIGSMWNANIVAKLKQIKQQWQLIRARHKADKAKQQQSTERTPLTSANNNNNTSQSDTDYVALQA